MELNREVRDAHLRFDDGSSAHALLSVGSVQKPRSSMCRLMQAGCPVDLGENGSWMEKGLDA